MEQQWAAWNDLDPIGMVACSSGTAALHLSLEAFQLRSGSEVLMSDFTMIACPRAVTLAGLVPVFVDCDERLLMSEDCYDKYLGDSKNNVHGRLGAVMFVHIYGRKVNVDKLGGWACDIGAKVVEDLAEAHGIKPSNWTDAAAWSFYKNKIVAGEEGGAVWFRNPEHAVLARQLRSLGFTDAHDFRHVPRGHNYRLANCLAEKVLGSFGDHLTKDVLLGRRRQLEAFCDELCPNEWRMPPRDVSWVYDLRLRGLCGEQQQTEVVRALNAAGIQARYSFKPMTAQPEYRVPGQGFTDAYRASREVIYLPIRPGIDSWERYAKAFDLIKRTVGA